jgi:phosphoribosylformylglycinamidine synthase
VGGKVAKQQTTGPLQLPLNNCGVMALITTGKKELPLLGHSPAALLDPVAGSRTAIAEALSNIVWAPIKGGLNGISLSATGCGLVKRRRRCSFVRCRRKLFEFCNRIGINIPTGKDSSMKQKYPNEEVLPGQLLFRQVETVPILESQNLSFKETVVLFIILIYRMNTN